MLDSFLARRDGQNRIFSRMLHVEALRRLQPSGLAPGWRTAFCRQKGGRDQVIYSLLRVRDAGLARELWIRLEEGEITLLRRRALTAKGLSLARGDGPYGDWQPAAAALQDLLRGLRPGEICSQTLGRMACFTSARAVDSSPIQRSAPPAHAG